MQYLSVAFIIGRSGPWSMDAAVLDRLREKEQTMLRAIDDQILETLPTSEEDLDMIFRKLRL